MRPAVVVAFACLACCPLLHAHNPGLSSLRVEAQDDSVHLSLRLPAPDLDGDGRVSAAELSAGEHLLRQAADCWVVLRNTQFDLPVRNVVVSTDQAGNALEWRAMVATAPTGRWSLTLAALAALGPGHREFVTVVSHGRTVVEALLSPEQPELAIDWTALPNHVTTGADGAAAAVTPDAAPRARTFADFFRLGVLHILTGYDHLLYLAGLIVACRGFRSILPIVTSFTLAHSCTLALATVGAVNLPPSIVEPLIAASIVYVAVENLFLRGREPRRRWITAFGFGLVHGFGFAGLLREIGVGGPSLPLAVPLFSFNLGVEAGQLAVVATALPVLAWSRRLPRFEAAGLPALSSLVAAFGTYWFVERIWF